MTSSSTSSPTIVRTTHKFGDYLTRPDLAKFELPKKMSRPWIVNNAFEQEKLKDLLSSEKPVETNEVFSHIKETKKDKRKNVGTNRKYIRNINDIIARDNKNVNATQKKVKCPVTKSRTQTPTPTQNVVRVASPCDAMEKQHAETGTLETKCQDNDAEMEEKKRELERDIEFEQQQMMNRMFNSPTTFSSAPPQFLASQLQSALVPVMVHNPAGGYYIVHLPLNTPLPAPPPPPPTNDAFFLPYSSTSSTSSTASSRSDDGYISRSSTASSVVSLPSSDDGYMDDSTDDISSLSEAFDGHLEISDVESEEEECRIEEDEELNRLVLSIIEE
jgi:hypothetical protein